MSPGFAENKHYFLANRDNNGLAPIQGNSVEFVAINYICGAINELGRNRNRSGVGRVARPGSIRSLVVDVRTDGVPSS